MEKICASNISDFFQNDFVIVEIIKCLDMKSLAKIKLVWRQAKEAIERENYTLFQKLREFLNIPPTFDSSSMMATEDVSEVFKYVVQALKGEPIDVAPFAYYTDGGVDTNSNYYFLQNVWKKTGIWYCTTAHSNVHVQSILSKEIFLDPSLNNPMKFLESPKNKLKIRIPIEKFTTSEQDIFHVLK